MPTRWLLLPLLLLARTAFAAPIHLGTVQLTGAPGKDVLALPACPSAANQPVSRLKLRITEHPAQIDHLEVVFGDGQKQLLPVRKHFAIGAESRWIDLIGPARCVTSIHVVGDADTAEVTPLQKTRVAFWGEAVPGAHVAATVAAKQRVPDVEMGTLLGRVRLTAALDHDVVVLAKCPSPGNKAVTHLRLAVHDFPADLDQVKVVFQDGQETLLDFHKHFVNGESSLWKDLPGDARCISRIVIVGDTKSIGFQPGAQALIDFYGR